MDATGELLALEELGGGSWWLAKLRSAGAGSLPGFQRLNRRIDGISLTIAALEGDVLSVTIIPHTYQDYFARRAPARRSGESGVRHVHGQARGKTAGYVFNSSIISAATARALFRARSARS